MEPFKCMFATEPVTDCPPVQELSRLREKIRTQEKEIRRLEQENRWMEEENRRLRAKIGDMDSEMWGFLTCK
ncbi:MAG: hypothetical protein IJT62_09185 [Oscillospiraceae bacterium]|nr:hypothetical protein [Oscillospiraceae bacterium]